MENIKSSLVDFVEKNCKGKFVYSYFCFADEEKQNLTHAMVRLDMGRFWQDCPIFFINGEWKLNSENAIP